MKQTILFAAAMTLTLGLGLFGNARTAGADIKPTEITEKPVETLSMRITAYASVPEETDDTPFITANGTHVHDGVVASNILPFGTKIQIPDLFGNKIFTVEDRMSKKIKNTIDIWMPTKLDAVDFGVTHTSVIVLGNVTSSLISEATGKGKTTL
jgi:3D (Asp-Asp-Asp) domain-containing protein